ncbi:MAG: 3-dehydroquinate synthase [Proteobacteria bacterium]|nr:3-dehydroquinate synthase [Pseudomonadota bacterium]
MPAQTKLQSPSVNADSGEDKTEAEISTIRVSLASNTTDYPIHIGSGCLADAKTLLAPLFTNGTPSKIIIIADAHKAVKAIADRLARSLTAIRTPSASDTIYIEYVAGGEASKSFASYHALAEKLLSRGIDRQAAIIAIGGGVVGDLAGFLAATLLRGVALIHIPTTLLAQADSAIGGKTGINSRHGKNLVGAFYQPKAVVIDPDCLATLSPREMLAGYAEIVKYGLLGDAGFFAWCVKNGKAVLNRDPAPLRHAISKAVAMKAAIVMADVHEAMQITQTIQTGQAGQIAKSKSRALLNLGHSFAHAFEAEATYDSSILHGEAVAAGMMCALALSSRLGFMEKEVGVAVEQHLAAVGLPVWHKQLSPKLASCDPDGLIAHIRRDKKAHAGKLSFVLMRDIGDAFIAPDIDEESVRRILSANNYNEAVA